MIEIKNLNDVVCIASVCKRYPELEIDAMCKNKRYIVNAKSMMGLISLMDGGEVTFNVIDTTKNGYNSFVNDLEELKRQFEYV